MFAKRVKSFGLCLIILLDIVLICPSITPVLAGTDDIVRKQKENERQAVEGKNERQRLEEAIYNRSLEVFDIVVSVLEELHKKGMKFERINNIKVVQGRKLYVRNYGDPKGYDPIIATEFNNEVIMHDSFLLNGETKIRDPYVIRFEPQYGGQICIEISTREYNDKHFYIKMPTGGCNNGRFSVETGSVPEVVIPLYDSNALKNKRSEIRKKLLERIEAVLK